ncbi:MAG: stage II sporulation protein M [Bacteroidota bacterium]
MRESSFINQNKQKWREAERMLDQNPKDPDQLNDLFIQVTDDLSYSRTFYPNRSVRAYLNGLAQKIFSAIYQKRKFKFSQLKNFAFEELPLIIYETRRNFLIATLVFLVAFTIGVVSSRMYPDFAETILGADYIEMTKENIAKGDPMAVYKAKGRFAMSLAITMNNVWVSFLTFILGIVYGIGTLFVLISNGVMVGAFQYFFIERGLFWESFLAIWTHGTIEISAIVIAGAAGLTMGRGLAFPGTYSRLRSFQQSAKKGLKIMVGIIPLFILAGFFEGYLTRQTDTPDAIRFVFILGCLAFIFFYFWLYPRMVHRRMGNRPVKKAVLAPELDQKIQFRAIKTSGTIFNDAFIFFRQNLRYFLFLSLGFSLIYCAFVFGLSSESPDYLFLFNALFLPVLSELNSFFINPDMPLLPAINIPLFATFFALVSRKLLKAANPGEAITPLWLLVFKALPGVCVLYLIMWTNSWFTFFVFVGLAFFPFLWMFISMQEKKNSIQALARVFELLGRSYLKTLALILVFMLIGTIALSIIDTIFFSIYFDLVSWLADFSDEQLNNISVVLQVGSAIFFLLTILSLITIGFGILYFTLLEIQEAPGLLKAISSIGKQNRIRGLEKEDSSL